MRRVLVSVASCLFFAPAVIAQPVVFPDGTTSDQPGGLMIIRKGNQTTWSFGGGVLPRSVKLVTQTAEGKEIARFKFPSVFCDPYPAPLPLPGSAPASVQVQIPDKYGVIYVDGELVRTHGTSRKLESPPLFSGRTYPLRLRAVFAVGDKLLIEDKDVLIRSGETTAVTFDGAGAVAVALPKPWVGPRPAPSERKDSVQK